MGQPGKLAEERSNAKIFSGEPWNFYYITKPHLSDDEREFIALIEESVLADYTAHDLEIMMLKDKKREKFIEKVNDLLRGLREKVGVFSGSEEDRQLIIEKVSDFIGKHAPFVEQRDYVVGAIVKDMVGLGRLSDLLEDGYLEEIMVNGPAKKVFVYDRTHGLCETNVEFEDDAQIQFLVKKISDYVKKDVSTEQPLIDARLPDGSRVNATIPPASPKGTSITIRKFRKKPITITELIASGTLTSDLAAFFWMAIEGLHVYPANFVIAGGTGSGKTSTMNALSVFIPPHERLVTIEDTLELNLYDRENWIQLEARPGIGAKPLEMNDLLVNSLRMRPDRVLVGEVRGPEANTMFIAMDTGHQGVMSTLHANTGRETILRLQSAPMSVPNALFSLLDLVVVQHRMYHPKKGLVRKVVEVSEASVMEDKVLLSNLYNYDRDADAIKRSSLPSRYFERLSYYTGLSINDVRDEHTARKLVLDYLVKKKIFDYQTIRQMAFDYYSDPEKVIKKIGTA